MLSKLHLYVSPENNEFDTVEALLHLGNQGFKTVLYQDISQNVMVLGDSESEDEMPDWYYSYLLDRKYRALEADKYASEIEVDNPNEVGTVVFSW